MVRPISEVLKDTLLLTDGAMGTMLYQKGVYLNTCFDELNLVRPELIKEVHAEYVHAGAEIIETNTFGANRFKLSAFGIEVHVKEINKIGAQLAREAAGEDVYVAGAIGPIGKPLRPIGKILPEDAYAAFREQVEALSPHVDVLILETIHSLEEMKICIAAVRDVTDLPIIAQMTFTEECRTLQGESPEKVVSELTRSDVTVIGCNCSIGPQPMLEIIERMRPLTNKPLSVMPNAGAPRLVEDRFIYLTSPEYMAEYAKRFIQAGASIIGGCCGTTPEHVKAMHSAIRALRPMSVDVMEPERLVDESRKLAEIPFVDRSRFARSLAEKFVISVEIDPPRGLDPTHSLDGARLMKEHGVDAINIADGPRASARMSPMVLAQLMETRVGIETILHYCCRDRNLLGMQSDLIGAHAIGLRNLLIITGDPPKLGDYPSATAVYDVDSIGLVRIVKNMNQGLDLANNTLGEVTRFTIAVGVNPGAVDRETEIRRFHEKVAGGAEYALTQPVYDHTLLERFLDQVKGLDIPILVGILPLISYKNAEFLHNEVPGMQIPERIRERLRQSPSGEKARETGIKIAQDALLGCKSLEMVKGAYIMPPLGKYNAALKVLEVL